MFSKRKFKDTGYLIWKNTATLTTGSLIVVALDLRFEPYNDCKIVNLNSDNDIEVTVNQHSTQIIPKGNQIQINQEIIKDLRLKNIGAGTVAINDIRVFYRNDGFEGRKILSTGSTILNVGANIISALR